MGPEAEAERAIHAHDLDGLRQLIAAHPALLTWTGDAAHAGLLGFATGAYGDAFGAEREGWFTRADAAELLIDAGAVVTPAVVEGILDSRAAGLLQLFQRKGLLPRSLNFLVALGDIDAIRESTTHDLGAINEAFIVAANFHHPNVAALLLERSVALDPDLASNADIDAAAGPDAFIKYFVAHGPFDRKESARVGLWRTFVMRQVKQALLDGDLPRFVGALQRDPWLLDDAFVPFQVDLIGWGATNVGRGEFIRALLDLDPALLRRQPLPPPKPIVWAFEYGHTALLPLLTRVWPVPDELPFAAGLGNLSRLHSWFGANPHTPQHVLDTALAYAITNKQFAAADLMLAHGANINTSWNTHEPASLLHHAVFLGDYEIMHFLVDRGIDMTIEDYRWGGTAQGWALYAMKDEKMATWLADQARMRR